MTTSAAQGNGQTSAVTKNPYGGKPGSGISLPPYFRPTPSAVAEMADQLPDLPFESGAKGIRTPGISWKNWL